MKPNIGRALCLALAALTPSCVVNSEGELDPERCAIDCDEDNVECIDECGETLECRVECDRLRSICDQSCG